MKNRNFMILVIGQVISLFGSAIQRFSLSLYLLDRTGSAGLFATMLAISTLPYILFAPVAGVLVDRGNRRNIMVVLDLISSVFVGGYAFLLMSGMEHISYIAVLMFALSAIATIYQPAVTASIPMLVEEKELVRTNGIVQQVSSLANFLGPIFAGVLYGFWGIQVILILNAVSFFASAMMELYLKIPHQKREEKRNSWSVFISEIKEGTEYLTKKNLTVLRMIATAGLFNLFLVPVFSVGAPYIIKITLSMSDQAYGIAEGVIALGMILGGAIMSIWPHILRMNRVYVLLYGSCISMLIMGLSILLKQFGATGGFISYMSFTFFGMIVMLILGMINVVTAGYVQMVVPREMMGKITAASSAFATLCVPLGQVIYGAMIERFSTHMVILVTATAVASFFVTLLVRYNVKELNNFDT